MNVNDDDFLADRTRWGVMLPPWLMIIGGTVLSLVAAGLLADAGLAVALVGFVLLMLRMHRTPEG
jgi:hypothetical protein